MRVYVVGGGYAYERMFKQAGLKLAASMHGADLLCFTGGADVSPELYDEVNVCSYPSPERDKEEEAIFDWAYEHDMPMVGICRGAQFLNVMNGGKVWQDVDAHAISGTHEIDCVYGGKLMVSSTHHQMMRPSTDAKVLAIAALATYKLNAHGLLGHTEEDAEVVYYPETKSLCYQPHPEIMNEQHECRQHFFMLIDKLMYGRL